MASLVTRREFLWSAGSLWAAMHAPLLATRTRSAWPGRALAPEAGPQLELLHLRLLAARFEEQVAFYRDTLRFPIARQSGDSVTFRAGSTELEFVPAPAGVQPMYHFAFNIPENQLDSARAWTLHRVPLLVQRSTGRDVLHFTHWNAHAFYFHDPDKNLVEFIARHTLSNAQAGDFDERGILSVSEIGVVAESVAATTEQLESRLGISAYLGRSDTFTPVGNEHGLFIVVNANRNWLLTNQPAVSYPTSVRVRAQREGTMRIAGSVDISSAQRE